MFLFSSTERFCDFCTCDISNIKYQLLLGDNLNSFVGPKLVQNNLVTPGEKLPGFIREKYGKINFICGSGLF